MKCVAGLQPLRGSLFTSSHYLVAFSGSHLTVWNLLSCTARWRIRLEVESVSVHPFTSSFVALIRTEDAQRQVIIEFDPQSAVPVATHPVDAGTVVCALAYVPLDAAAVSTRCRLWPVWVGGWRDAPYAWRLQPRDDLILALSEED